MTVLKALSISANLHGRRMFVIKGLDPEICEEMKVGHQRTCMNLSNIEVRLQGLECNLAEKSHSFIAHTCVEHGIGKEPLAHPESLIETSDRTNSRQCNMLLLLHIPDSFEFATVI